MKLYNTMTQSKEEFVPLMPGKAGMYVCGPTVYNYIHIGNARPLIVFDALRRYLEYIGYEVIYVQNITDIDDKIINRANEENTTTARISGKYTEEFIKDARGLGVRDAAIAPKATENITEMIAMVSDLIDKGLAYEADGDVYFRAQNFKEYGKLSKQSIADLQAGARVDTSDIKENQIDFALWKASKPKEPCWDSPWGKGRPGWHLECSVMARKFLGNTIDIHCGGVDLIFPHHENEIAQSEGANGCEFARFWLHNGFINIDSKKMSKSLGNFFTVREAAEKYGYENIRMFILMSHYRSPINFSGQILEQSKNALDRIRTAKTNLEFLAKNGSDGLSGIEKAFIETLPEFRGRFRDALDDDFNTADAIAVIFELVREANSIASGENPSKQFAAETLNMLAELTDVLGLLYAGAHDGSDDSLSREVGQLIAERQAARAAKDWAKADTIRDKLSEMGIILEDTPQGVKWRKA